MSFQIKGWCPTPNRPMQSGDGWLLRLKPLGGALTATQAMGIANAAREFGNGQLELTNRGAMQIRGIAENGLAACLRQLDGLGIDHQGALAAITLAPYLSRQRAQPDIPDDLAHDLAAVLARFPQLPAKFGLVIDCGPTPVLGNCPGDLRIERAKDGLCLRIDGRALGHLVAPQDLGHCVAQILTAFCASGVVAGRGRMRDWQGEWQSEWLGEADTAGSTSMHQTAPLPGQRPTPGPYEGDYLHAVPFGAITADLLEAAALTGPVTITPWRMIGLPARLDHPSLITRPDDALLRTHACIGAPGCSQGHAATRPLARRLSAMLGADQSLHVAGCAKLCAHPAHLTARAPTRAPSHDRAHDPTLAPASAPITLIASAQGFHLAGHPLPNPDTSMIHSYETNGQAIYDRSFAIIRAEADLARFAPIEERVAVRMIHASGLVGLERDIAFTPDFALTATTALKAGAPILCDARMVSQGITTTRLPAGNQIICTLHDPQVPILAEAMSNTRSAAALELWRPHLAGAVVAIGNAPTALFHLLNMLSDPDCPRPAAIIGCPVGFVGAAESKEALIAAPPVPALVVNGRLGGSAVTVAAVNALASERE